MSASGRPDGERGRPAPADPPADPPAGRWRWLSPAAVAGGLAVRVLALWTLARHPDTPRAVKWLALAVVAYAASPIDLIPDAIPVLGLLDDLLLIPLGVALVVRLTPPALWQACLRQAEASADRLPRLMWGAVAVIVVWLALAVALAAWGWTTMTSKGT